MVLWLTIICLTDKNSKQIKKHTQGIYVVLYWWLWAELNCASQKGSLYWIRSIQHFNTFILKKDWNVIHIIQFLSLSNQLNISYNWKYKTHKGTCKQHQGYCQRKIKTAGQVTKKIGKREKKFWLNKF